MARTPLMQFILRARNNAFVATPKQSDTNIDLNNSTLNTVSRRHFIRRSIAFSAGGVGLTALGHWRLASANAATLPRIAVIGAGLAGLTCAYRLRQAGLAATVYEASDRVGGRCWTLRGAFADDQIVEQGGELIDTRHIETRQLAHELGLELENLLQSELHGTKPCYYFNQKHYGYEQASRDIKKIWKKVHADVTAAGYPSTYKSHTPRGLALDRMSIVDWINESVPGGIQSTLGQLLDVAYNIEFGAESAAQSSLNLLYLLGYIGQGNLRIFGPSNEKFHVQGGNDQLTTRLAALLEGQIELGSALTAIRRNTDSTLRLSITTGQTTLDHTFDSVIVTVPFSVLNTKVDLSHSGFSAVKMQAIRELGMGTNTKLHVQFNQRYWRELGCNGDSFSDRGYQSSWEVTRAQSGTSGILVDYTGGHIGAAANQGTPVQKAEEFLTQIEPVLPGISEHWNNKVTRHYWADHPWALGSYSYYKVGQYTQFGGAESESEGNCHFAGEHTSRDYQGYLQGAVHSGEAAAQTVLASLKKSLGHKT